MLPEVDRIAILRILTAMADAANHSPAAKKVKYQKAHPLGLLIRIALMRDENHTNGISVTDVSKRMGATQSAISRAAAASVKGGTIRKVPMLSDKRATCLELTARGEQFVDEVVRATHKAITQERRRLQK